MTPRLTFWFEFASTYSYVAAARIGRVAADAGVDVTYRPFLLGPIFRSFGWDDSPFNIYPVKGRYMWRDLERLTSDLGIPFRRPTTFPRNGLLAARVALATERHGAIHRFVPDVYEANFARDLDIASREVMSDILAGIGLDAATLLAEADAEPVKAHLRANTEQATAAGIFGAPAFTVGTELFWGNDRLDSAVAWARRGHAPETSPTS